MSEDLRNEFQLIDDLALLLGIAAPESEEERNMDVLYKRKVLRAAKEFIESNFKDTNAVSKEE